MDGPNPLLLDETGESIVDWNQKYLVSLDFPAIVIDKIKGRFMIAEIPLTRQSTRRVDNIIPGKTWKAFSEGGIPIRFRRFYSGVKWESLENLKRYPVLMNSLSPYLKSHSFK